MTQAAKKAHAPKAGTTPAPAAKPVLTKAAASTATVESTHDALVAIGLMLAFVFVMVMVAGVGPKAGKSAVLVMVVLLAAQAVGHVNPFVTWASKHPLQPGDATFTTSTSTPTGASGG